MTPASDPPPVHGTPLRSRRFLLGYGAAQAGAFICFIPLLTLLLPTKAAAIAGPDKALLLSQIAMAGGFAAAVGNIVFGALSDRTRRFGRRRPWILAGLAAVAVTLGLIAAADTPLSLMLAIVGFQLAVNALYAPLTAIVPDMVPQRQKGTLTSLASAALPIANVFTALAVVALAGSIGAQMIAIVAAATVLILPFALALREPAVAAIAPTPRRLSLIAFRDVRFALAFSSRLLAECGVAINTLFLLFLIQSHPPSSRPPGWSVLETFSALLLATTLAALVGGLTTGPLSDRSGRRAPFVIAGGIGMAVGLALLAGWSDWPGLFVAQIVFGCAHGVHAAAVAVMNAEILPDPTRAGRDLGLMNLAVALPQGLAPAIAAGVLFADLPLTAVFALASLGVGVAALVLAPLARTV